MKQVYRFKKGDYFKYEQDNKILVFGKIIYISYKADTEDTPPLFYYKEHYSNFKKFFGSSVPTDRFYYKSMMYNNSQILTKEEFFLEVL
jgi:hypothetical protein